MNLLQKDIWTQIFYYTFAFIVISYTISKGVKKGIEKLNNILMPMLIVILTILFIYSIQLDGFMQALTFMFSPNFDKFHSSSLILAVGHAFFSHSLWVW